MSQSQPTTRRLVRRTDDKVLAGVCSGLGRHFGLDPIIFRIAFVVLALTGGSGVLLYLAMWVIVPADTDPPERQIRARNLVRIAGTIVIAIASLWIVGVIFSVLTGGLIGSFVHISAFDGFDGRVGLGPFEVLVPAAIFIGIGMLLLREPPEAESLPPASATEVATETPTTLPEAIVATPIVRRERSPLTLLTLAAALSAVGIGAVLGNLDIFHMDVGQLAALGLFVLGIGLIAGTWYGRGRWLILFGLAALPFVLAASLINFPPNGSIGSRYLVPTTSLPDSLELLAGDINIDLSHYKFPDGDEDLHVRMGVGSLYVQVPEDVFVDVAATSGLGEAYVMRAHDSGFDLDLHASSGSPLAEHRLNLVVEGGIASINVYRIENYVGRERNAKEEKKR